MLVTLYDFSESKPFFLYKMSNNNIDGINGCNLGRKYMYIYTLQLPLMRIQRNMKDVILVTWHTLSN